MSELLQSISEAYWLKKLHGLQPVTVFAEVPAGASGEQPAGELRFGLPESQATRLAAVAAGSESSTYLILLSVLDSLIYKYTGETNVLVATAGFRASEPGHGPARTFFRTPLDAATTPRRLLQQNLAQLNELLAHPAPGHLEEERFGSDAEQRALRQFGWWYAGFNTDAAALAETQLLFGVEPAAEGYALTVRFQPACYSAAQAQQLGEQYLLLLALFLGQPDRPLSHIHLLSPADEARLVATERAHAGRAPRQTLVAWWEQQVLRHPGREALRYGERVYTYAELNAQANRLARKLREDCAVGPDGVVGVLVSRSDYLVIAVWGILKAGAAFLPLEAALPARRKQYMLEDAQSKVLLTQSDYLGEIDYYPGQVFALDIQLDALDPVAENPAPAAGPDNLAYVLYTSGSTGNPKGVEVRHRSIVNYLAWANRYYFGNETEHRFALFTALTFDLTLTSLFASLLNGGGLTVAPDQPVDVLLRLIFGTPSAVNAVKLTPSHVDVLSELGLTSTHIRTVILGGEALHARQIQALKSLNASMRVFNEYGPTETTVGCTAAEVTGTEAGITIGQPIDHTSIYILDQHRTLLPAGVAGEIGISGAGLARAYRNLPAHTAGRFVSLPLNDEANRLDLYLSGDLGVVLPNGEIRYLGRKDNQVKIRGYRVELGEIEACLRTHPAVREVLVRHAESGRQPAGLVAYFRAEPAPDASELRRYLAELLPEYMVPAYWVPVAKFPLTLHGKIDTKALPSPQEALTGRATYEAPANALEAALVRIWEDTLGIAQVGVHDSFFSLGGDSLAAIRVSNKVGQLVGEPVPFVLLFDAPSVRAFARQLPAAGRAEPSEGATGGTIGRVPPAEYYEVSHAQERIWLTAQLEDNQVSYNICGARELTAIDRVALEKAFRALVKRHESLRTVFINQDGRPKQKILPPDVPFGLEYQDLRWVEGPQEKVAALAHEDSRRPFALDRGPLFRARLLQLDEHAFVLLFALHHIISDGWTMDVLFNDLSALYEGFAAQGVNVLPPLPIQYKDYAAWEGRQLQGEPLRNHRAYWLAQFAGELPVLELPTDFPRPAVRTYNGATTPLLIDEKRRNQLWALSQQQNVTLFMTLTAVLHTLFFRYTRQRDIILGSPFGGRTLPELENQAGIFINVLAFRARIGERETFNSLLKQTKETVLGAYEHQVYPFDMLVKDLALRRHPGRSPLFDVMFSMQNTGVAEMAGPEALPKQEQEIVTENSKYDLTIAFSDFQKGIFTSIKYNRDLFGRETIEGMKTRLLQLLDGILANPDVLLEEISLGPEKKQQAARESLLRQRFNTKF